MNYWQVRVTILENKPSYEEIKDFTNRHTEIVLVKEFKSYDPDIGPHWQGYYYGDKSLQTVKRWIKDELGCRGNEAYSLKQADIKKYQEQGGIEGYFRYICKSKSKDEPPKEYLNISESDVIKYNQQYWKLNEQTKLAKKNKPKRTQELIDYVTGKDLTNIDLMKEILKFHYENALLISDFQAELYYHFLKTHCFPDEYIGLRSESLVRRIHDRMSHTVYVNQFGKTSTI